MFLRRWWNRTSRAVDFRILTASIRDQAPHRGAASKVASFHMRNDPSWKDSTLKEQRDFHALCCDGLPTQAETAIINARGGPEPDHVFRGYA